MTAPTDHTVRGVLDRLPATPFRPCPGVHSTQAADCIVLLNGLDQRYHTLNEVAGRMWVLLSEGTTPSKVVDRICAEYDALPEQVAIDLSLQITLLQELRLLEPVQPVTPTRAAPATVRMRHGGMTHAERGDSLPGVLRCLALITWLKLWLRFGGFGRTIHMIRRRVAQLPPATSSDRLVAQKVEWRVALAGAVYPGRAQCLEQSLVLYYLLRRRGIGAAYRQGVQARPFTAHAWVELGGVPLNDVAEHVKLFSCLPDQLP